jgi:hypothetical protein
MWGHCGLPSVHLGGQCCPTSSVWLAPPHGRRPRTRTQRRQAPESVSARNLYRHGRVHVPPNPLHPRTRKSAGPPSSESFFDLRECSFSELASFRGRIQHHSASGCIPYTLPFVALVSSLSSARKTSPTTIARSPCLLLSTRPAGAVIIRGILEGYTFRGRPTRPFVPSTLHAAFLAGEAGSAHIAAITS